jgi:hypothetical protein
MGHSIFLKKGYFNCERHIASDRPIWRLIFFFSKNEGEADVAFSLPGVGYYYIPRAWCRRHSGLTPTKTLYYMPIEGGSIFFPPKHQVGMERVAVLTYGTAPYVKKPPLSIPPARQPTYQPEPIPAIRQQTNKKQLLTPPRGPNLFASGEYYCF